MEVKKMKVSEIVEVIIVAVVEIAIAMVIASIIPLPAAKIPIGILIFLASFLGLLRFTPTKEGTAQAVTRLGGLKKIVIAWKEHKLDKEDNVIEGEEFHLPGGLRYVGIKGLDKVHKYHFRWYSVELRAGEEPKVQFKDVPDMDYILVKPDTYWSKIVNAETKDGMIVDIEFLDTIRVINPRKALFVAPPNWLENALSRLNALRTGWVRGKTFDYIRKIRKDPQKLWKELGNDPLIQKTFKEDWGLQIEEKGMQIYKINLLPEYQAALAREKQMELETKAKIPVEEREREAEKIELQHVKDRAIEIRDGVNLSPKDAIEVVQTERGKVTKQIIEYKGLEGVRGLPLITIGGERMPMGRGPPEERERPERKRPRKRLSDEEYKKALHESVEEALGE
jgi:hypothetical protein